MSYEALTVRSLMIAVGAFFITEAMPLVSAALLEYFSLEPIILPLEVDFKLKCKFCM